jgi:hypothetical protein
MQAEEDEQRGCFSPSEVDMWRLLERERLDFRFVQDPVFNLSDSEETLLERLRHADLEFGVLPRQDPTNFLTIKVRLEGMLQRVEIAVDPRQGYASFVTRRNSFAERLKDRLDNLFGTRSFDRSKNVTTRSYVWFAYYLTGIPAVVPRETRRRRSSLFNFDARERELLDQLELAVSEMRDGIAQIHVYPRETSFGGIELMLQDPHHSQPARVFVKGLYPLVVHAVTENTVLGQRMRAYFDRALGSESLDVAASRFEGKFLSLVYRVRTEPRL